MKKILSIFILSAILLNFPCAVFSANLDTSIDEEIRKKYNPSKIEEDLGLPPLPKNLEQTNVPETKTGSSSTPKPSEATVKIENKQNFIDNNTCVAKIKKGKKLKLKSNSQITDRLRKGTKVSFTSIYPITTTYFTIPYGTKFYGEVFNSHLPKYGGNGGLVVVNITSFVLNGNTYFLEAKTTKVKKKKIFFNNIKGERRYLNGLVKSNSFGAKYFKKMLKVSKNLSKDVVILCPFPVIIGTLVYAGNLVASPFIAIKYKGGRVIIDKDSIFEFKLTDDFYISR